MNKCRSKKIMWKLNKSIAKELLPTQPVDFPIEPWWGVCLVNFTLEEFKKLSEEEMATIDKICKEEANAFILFDPDVIKGFVSNKEQSYEDPIEELLYAVFVVSSENATVAELASTLQADLNQLQAAASFVCRLGWAVKVIDPASVLQENTGVPPHGVSLADEEDASHPSSTSANMSTDRLKSHAVTLYEAGKLGHASIADLCKDLSTLEGTKFEGELQEFANHAFSLRCVLECLLSGGVANDTKTVEIPDRMGVSASVHDESTLVADNSLTDVAEQSTNETGENINDTNNLEICREGSVGDDSVPETIGDDRSATLSKDGNLESEVSKSDLIVQNDDKLIQMEGPEIGKGTSRRKKKYRVDILRCESLAALPKTTLDRLFLRDYDIVVSMVPLPYSSVLPGPTGPINFGPPSHSSMTPWMKLVLYSTVASGPLSVVLMKGQCLRMLPAPLAGCEKALLWSWDGSTIGGLGGKFEGNLVKGSVLLHCLNSLLKCSAVIVQPFSRYDLDGSGKVVTLDIPLPLKNSDGSVALVGDELGLCAEECSKLNDLLTDLAHKIELWTVGYIRLLKLFKERESDHFAPNEEKYEWVPLSIEFGMPLFSPKLCNNICERIVTSRLLQADSLTEQHDSMQSIRKRLRDVCAEYQATGPAAKLLYQKEHQKDHSKELSKHLMNYASGRWNPLLDPSSPISGASSEHQRLKLASRQRCRTEVLSFDGSILRSYALTPVYEAATRPIDDSTPETATKVDPDETDSKEIILPGVNLLFDGAELHPFDIGACLQARQPISLIAEAASASTSFAIK
ncbi:FAM91 [Theobroma cacao]|nr:FAM91 [Theobroma cacao]